MLKEQSSHHVSPKGGSSKLKSAFRNERRIYKEEMRTIMTA